MSARKFQGTPGPWEITRNNLIISGNLVIGGVEPFPWVDDFPDAKANARLIAEAPAMYELLADLELCFGKMLPECSEFDAEFCNIKRLLDRVDNG